MALLSHVQPGQVIRASAWNGLVDEVNALQTGAPGSGVTVPNVIGQPLSQARTLLTQPPVNLSLGTTIDAFGQLVDPDTSGSRVVINQTPNFPMRVPVGSAVDLLLAAQSGTGPGPQPLPVITGFNNTATKIGQPITIQGDNFDPSGPNNTVTIDGTGAGIPSPASKTSLTVVVPPVSNPPTGSQQKTVDVIVTTGAGSSVPKQTLIEAPSANPTPTILNIDTSPNVGFALVGQTITITGTNYSTTPANNKVVFNPVQNNIQVTPTTVVSPTELTVVVPQIPGVNPNQPPKPVGVVVRVGANQSFPEKTLFVKK
jgi:IPT/TIG domain/PASTA domain